MLRKKDKNVLIVASFEDASILRKFTILFLVASVIPTALLYYMYTQNSEGYHSDLTETSFTIAIALMIVGVLAGYFSMRSLLTKVVKITQENKKALEGFLSPETIKELNKGKNEIVMLSRSFSAVTKQLEENIRSLEIAKKTLHSVMAKVGQGISNMENIDTFLLLIVETMTNALSGKVGTLITFDEKTKELIINTVYGTAYDNQKPIHLKLEGTPFNKIIDEKRPMIVSGVFLKNLSNPRINTLFAESLLCAPLIYGDKVSGIITLSKADDANGNFSEEDSTLLFNLASQTAVALENSKLNRDIERTYFETISALALAVDAKDKYSRGHLDRVADYTTMIGKHLGLDEDDLNTLRDAARLHDLGKIGIPDEILKKDGSLSDEEWVIMRRHPEIGESIIKPVHSLNNLCDLIRHHHEKLDGTGYPDGLKGEEISPLVRILTVADVFDALTTERSYRPRKSRHEAAQILRSMKNQLDQDIVEIFLERLETHTIS